MAHTKERTICNVCGKKNLSTWEYQGNEYTKCMTEGCNNNKSHSPTSVGYSALIFDFPTTEYRGISTDTCKLLGIKLCTMNPEIVEYTHNNLDNSIDYKIRFPGKEFIWKPPKHKTTSMFALDKCNDFSKPLYITEGVEDCATLWDLGFQSASILSAGNDQDRVQCVIQDLEKINKFPEIIVCIENDQTGKVAKNLLKKALAHKLLREVDLSPRKDANDWVRTDLVDMQPDRAGLVDRLTNSKEIVPSGIIFGNDIDVDELYQPLPKGIMLPYPKLNDIIRGGILPGDLWIVCAGVSIGKSSLVREWCVHFKKQGYKVGNIFIEESKKVSMLNYVAAELGYPIGDIIVNPTIIPKDEFNDCCNKMLNDPNLMFVDEYWERSTTNLLKTIEYLAKVKKYDIIVLDHITAIINSSGIGRGGKVHDIDWLMEQLFILCRQTGIRILAVSHLKRPNTPPYWDEGRKPSMYDLRGSGSLEGKPDVILGLSRNMKPKNEFADTPINIDILGIEVLKNRWFSRLGQADELIYLSKSGRLELY